MFELPTDRPRPPVQRFSGARHSFALSAPSIASITKLCHAEDVTPFMALFAVFGVVLHRYSGAEKILVGVPVASNTLAFAADLSGDPTFVEVIRRVRHTTLEGSAHAELPFASLVEELQPPRDASRHPIVQVAFGNVADASAFELVLAIDETAGSVEYDAELFDGATITRFIHHFEVLVERLAADPTTRVSRVPLLTSAERQQMLVDWNATACPLPDHRIEELFEQQALRTPENIAVRFDGAQLTYRELDARSNQLAHRLRELGVSTDVLVPICVERSLEMLVGFLGILKAGGAYVPLDPEYPLERLAFMLEDCEPRVIVTQGALAGRLPPGSWDVVCLDAAELADRPREKPARGGTPESLAYGIYTSGTTGTPKCALVMHRGVVNVLVSATHDIDANDRVLLKSALTFDASVPELFAPLRVGACVVVARPGGHKDVRYLLDVIRAEQITMVMFVPSLLDVIVDDPAFAECRSLRRIAVGGEALSPDLQARFFAQSRAELHNGYGPTETTIFSTYWPCRRDSTDRTVPIGRPIANTQVYVLDARQQPVPVGVFGELYIGGVGVARGYLHRPELTAERFVPDPFGGSRLYRTGDIVRYRADGNLEYVGRTDHQTKIRGFRVELGEIEACLRAHAMIRDVVVIAREDHEHVIAYLVARREAPPVEELRSHLRARLPEYMVPAGFVFLDAIPLTASGKVDRKALPAPLSVRTEPLIAPRTTAEELVARIWREVLHLEEVGVRDDFFELGGHSLLAMQVVARIRDAANVTIAVGAFFDAPTIEDLARVIDAGSHGPVDVIPRVSRSEPAPLSSSQEQLWFLHALDPTSVAYNIPFALRLRGTLDEAALARSVDAIVRRHDVLRATIAGTIPRMHVSPHTPHALHAEPVGSVHEAELLAAAEVRRSFDFERGPLFRTRLLRLGADDHILVVTMHHIISDGWSCDVFLQELLDAYAGRPLPEPAIQFADYATWERTRPLSTAYWRDHVAGFPVVIELPTDRTRPPVQTVAGARQHFVLPASTVDAIVKLCRSETVTPFMTLFALFSVLLHRYTGQDRLLVGVPVANRERTETEGAIGMFVNTLAFAADVSGDPTFRDVLARARTATLGGFAHQHVPFNKLVEELQPARDLSRSPIVQVMFAYQSAAVQASGEASGLAVSRMPIDTGTSKFELMLELVPRASELVGAVEYNTDLFDASTIARFIRHFEVLVEGLVTDPTARVSRIPLLTLSEQRLMAAWNDTARGFPDCRIEELFEQQALRTPDAIAVSFGSAQLTYRELDARANQLAHRLRELGVGPDVLVPIYVERSLEMLAGILGILKADGAYVPLDPEYPADRLAFMLNDCAPRVVVTHARFRERLPAGPWRVLCLDDDIADRSRDTPPRIGRAENLAYGIYTSGSTGAPKCALVMHRGVVSLLLEETYHLDATDRVLQKTPLTFDASVPELFGPLRVGARVVVARPEGHKDVRYLIDVIRAEQITSITFVPSLLEVFVNEPAVAECSSLRRVLVGGEALSYDAQTRFFARSRAELHNTYGPTETTVTSSYWPCQRESRDPTVPIGRPVGNTQLYVLDARRQPVPIGVLGELYIGGVGLARGYLNRPELTSERFVSHAGARLYRTGDVVRHRADGTLEYLGRTDHQVKIRGFRVELGEIEVCLRAHPAVRDAVVIARDKHLVAYVVGASHADELRSLLRGKLPDYMVPSGFVFLDAFPLMVNGKVDRKALPAPAWSARAKHVAPETAMEELVAQIWREVLGVDQLGVCDDFFELGGHSLLAMQVVSRIRDATKVEITVRAFFDAPTIRDLARAIDAGTQAPADVIPTVSCTEPVRLTATQEQLWFLHALSSAAYNIPFVLRLRGPLDETALATSVDEIVRRHDILRATIVGVGDDDVPHIRVSPHVPHLLRAEPVASLHDAETLISAVARAGFDFERGPLIRTRLLRLGAEDHVLVVTTHHIISDGWSSSVFEHELLGAYEALSAGKPWSEPALAIQYADYASWERARSTASALAYWKDHLTGAPTALELPTDRARPPVQTFAGARERFVLQPRTNAAIAQLCRSQTVTPFMALFAVFGVLLHRYTGQDKVLVGVPAANRSRVETERMIGLFVNTLAFAADLSGDPTFAEVLQRVRTATLAGFAHQDLPFTKLVEALQPARDSSRTPIVQVMFAYQSATHESSHRPAGLAVTHMPVDTGTSKFELMLELEPRGTEMSGVVEYNTGLFDRSTIARFIEHFELLALALAEDPTARVSHVPLLTPTEHEQLLAWNATERAFPDARVEELFEQQVEKTPDAVAVRFERAQLTYRELDARADQLAHRLRELGVGPGALVPIYIERSLEMLPGILGILKAGGAYVPLDPEYPPERLTFMLEDCAPRVIVTQARLVDRIPVGPWRVVDAADFADRPRDKLARAGTTADVAYGIYTSGSTGTPKCALVVHRGVANLMSWMQETYQLDATDRVLQKTPLIFDASVREIFWPLLHGACVVVARPDGHKDVSYLLDVIRAEQITTINFVPSLLEIFVEEPGLADCGSLRRVLSGGEALSEDLRARFYARSKAKLYNHYGPTETTVTSAFWPCPREAADRAIPIGRPIANTQLHVLDARRQRVPIGVPGELYIGGVGLAREYLNRPELTTERFVPDPFTPGAQLYRTGDVVRYRADGALEYLGRTDHQVKIRGFRIELGEIEACLRTHPAVRDVVVMAREDVPGQKHLVAYIVGAAQLDELQSRLRTALPEYMIPSAFVFLDAFPLMVNGKVDRKALPAPVRSSSAFVAPRNPTEERIAQIWCDVLGLDRVGVTDDFFGLGGHSLLAMQVVARIRRAFDVDIPVRTLLLAKTIEAQARVVARAGDHVHDLSRFIVRSDNPIARATIAQEQFWYLSQDDPDPTAYFISNAFMIEGPLDRALLEQSYRELVAYHSIFRTTFREIDGLLHQIVLPELPVPPSIEFEERADVPADDDEIKRCVAELMTRPCDLARGIGVIRSRLIALAPGRHLLIILMHHIVSDGAGLTQQLFEGYARLRGGAASALPDELPLQYIDFAHARARWSETPQGKSHRAYWEERARDAPPLELPSDFPRAPLDARRDALPFGIAPDLNYPPEYMPLPATVRDAVVRGARSQATTPYMIYLGALAWLFHQMSSQDEISIQTTYSNRLEYPVLEQVQGPLAWWTHIRIDASGRPDFRELIRRTGRAVEGAREHGIVDDYFQLVPHPVRRSTFNYLPLAAIPYETRVSDLNVVKKRLPFPKWKRHWDIHLTLMDFANDTVLVWTGTEKLFRRDTVLALLHRYVDILAHAAD